MTTMPTVVVRKGGFLSAFCYGFFGLLTTCVLCGSGLGFYALHTFRASGGDVAAVVGRIAESLPEWQKALPPALADAVNDVRAADYVAQVNVTAQVVESRRDRVKVLIEATNKGARTVSMLALNVQPTNSSGVPSSTQVVYAATPLAISDEWPGPIMPGSTRKVVRWMSAAGEDARAEIAELRVASDRALAHADQ